MKIGLIFARGSNQAFGYKNSLPWPFIKEDMQHFVKTTKGAAVFMGRKTWDSLTDKKPLPGRLNIILSNKQEKNEYNLTDQSPIAFVKTIEEGMLLAKLHRRDEFWIIGGSGLIERYQHHASVAHVTEIQTDALFDVSAPKLNDSWKLVNRRERTPTADSSINYGFLEYARQ